MFSEELKEEIKNFAKEIKPGYEAGDITGLDILFSTMDYLRLVEKKKGVLISYQQRLDFYKAIVEALGR